MIITEMEIIHAILAELGKTPVRENGRVVLVMEKCGNCKKFKVGAYSNTPLPACERGYATYPGCEKWEYYP